MDLVSKYNLQDGLAYAPYGSMMSYPNFVFRSWMNGTLYNAFANEIKSAMKDISTPYENIVYDGGFYINNSNPIAYISEKVKTPSMIELGMADMNSPSKYVAEGTRYPIFTSISKSSTAVLKNTNGSYVESYWTRSLIPTYWDYYIPGPAMVVHWNNDNYASIYFYSGDSTENYQSWATRTPAEPSVGYYYNNNGGKTYIGIMGIIRF